MVSSQAHKRAVRRLWEGVADILVWEPVQDPETGRAEPELRSIASGQPCHLAFTGAKPAQPFQWAAQADQSATLLIDPDLEIPEGSKIVVTQNGVTREYGRSGVSAVYSTHQQVPLTVWTGKEWA